MSPKVVRFDGTELLPKIYFNKQISLFDPNGNCLNLTKHNDENYVVYLG